MKRVDDTIEMRDGKKFRITADPLERTFAIGVPHQRKAFLAYPDESEPIEEDGDDIIEGDHDLHMCHLIETLDDALPLLDFMDDRGGQSRHEAIKVAVLIRDELIEQGVLDEIMEDSNE
jgi:hypothetical protein